jgi:fatty acid desaturase
MAEAQRQHSIHNLFGEALRDSSDLARKEFTLFKTEMAQSVRALFIGIAMMVAAAVFAIAALGLLTEALVEWLATVVNSEALAALIVGGVMLVLAIACALWGRSKFNAFTLTPERTMRNVRRDTQVLSERVSG